MLCLRSNALLGTSGAAGPDGGLRAMGRSRGGAALHNVLLHRRPQAQPGPRAAVRVTTSGRSKHLKAPLAVDSDGVAGYFTAYDVRRIDELSGRTTGRLGDIRPDTANAIGGTAELALRYSIISTFSV